MGAIATFPLYISRRVAAGEDTLSFTVTDRMNDEHTSTL